VRAVAVPPLSHGVGAWVNRTSGSGAVFEIPDAAVEGRRRCLDFVGAHSGGGTPPTGDGLRIGGIHVMPLTMLTKCVVSGEASMSAGHWGTPGSVPAAESWDNSCGNHFHPVAGYPGPMGSSLSRSGPTQSVRHRKALARSFGNVRRPARNWRTKNG
jgi:hypothetical protein